MICLSLPFIFTKSPSFVYGFLSFCFGFILNYFIISIFRFNKTLLKIWIAIILVIASLSAFFINNDSIVFSRTLIKTIFVASVNEAMANFHYKIVIYFVLLGLLPIILLFTKVSIQKPIKTGKRSFPFSILMLIFIGVSYIFFQKEWIAIIIKHRSNLIAYDPVESIIEAGIGEIVYKILDKKHQIEPLTNKHSFKREEKEELTVVLIIGESARSDRFGVLGYEKNTTPLLSSLNDLYAFKASACATLTLKAVPCMLSPLNASNFELDAEMGFATDVFNKYNFETSLISTNDVRRTDSLIAYIYNSFKNSYSYPGQIDEVALPKLTTEINKSGNKFIVFHSYGSHFQYQDRYPKEFEILKPACNKAVYDCSKEEINNVYDNTIIYTDYIINEIIKKLKDKNAILFFVSDHGQSLGEYGIYKHGIPVAFAPQAQIDVPFFVWQSEKFKQLNPEKAKALSSFPKTEEISHDFLFHSLLDCSSFEGELIDKSLSLCQPKKSK